MPASGEHPRIKSSTVSFLPAGCEPSDAEADAIFSVGMAKPAETLFESLASPEEGATRPAPAPRGRNVQGDRRGARRQSAEALERIAFGVRLAHLDQAAQRAHDRARHVDLSGDAVLLVRVRLLLQPQHLLLAFEPRASGVDPRAALRRALTVALGVALADAALESTLVFALGALVCAALNDIVFRKYASLRLSVGWYVSTIGFSWALLQMLLDLAAAGSRCRSRTSRASPARWTARS